MTKRNIIVISASAGGFEALKKLVSVLPKGFSASIFIVRHTSPEICRVLPQVLDRAATVHAAHACDSDSLIKFGSFR